GTLGITTGLPPDRQTTQEADELELAPEYDNQYPTLYDPTGLADAGRIWPWRFPFDLNHAKRRIYLDAIGLARTDVLRLVSGDSFYDIADAALDLTDTERALLLTASSVVGAYGSATSGLSSVPNMLARAQLGFQDLYALTQLAVINPGAGTPLITPSLALPPLIDPATWVPPLHACDPSKYTLNFAGGAAGDSEADRIHRF